MISGGTLGERCLALRVASGLTLRETAGALGKSPTSISNVETEKTVSPRIDLLLGLAALFGADVAWLMNGDGAGPSHAALGAAVKAATGRTVPHPPEDVIPALAPAACAEAAWSYERRTNRLSMAYAHEVAVGAARRAAGRAGVR